MKMQLIYLIWRLNETNMIFINYTCLPQAGITQMSMIKKYHVRAESRVLGILKFELIYYYLIANF